MKRAERHHLKGNELANLALRSREVVEERKQQFVAIGVALIVVAAAALGYYAWRQNLESRAHTLLAEAMVVDEAPVGPAPADQPTTVKELRFANEQARAQAAVAKFKAAADQYPSTDAGIYARYREGTLQLLLGAPDAAAAALQQVVDRDGNGIYGQMAKLGLAEAQARAGKFDQAIAAYKDLASNTSTTLPVDGILMQLGRTYLTAGKPMDAEQTFNRIVTEFPDSQFVVEARQELDTLKKT
jgi:TolA-binding protein